VIEFADAPGDGGEANRIVFSQKFACPTSGFTIPRSSRGCSRSTTRSGPARLRRHRHEMRIDPDLIVPDETSP
jgi:excinuclease ABC subunit A